MADHDAAALAHSNRSGRRIDRARRIVLLLSMSTPVFCVLTSVFAAGNFGGPQDGTLSTAASRAPGGVGGALSLAAVLCSLVLAYASMRVMRTRIDRPATALRRDVVLSYLALLVTVGLLGPNPAALSTPQFWAASVAVTGRVRHKAGYTVLMLAAGLAPLMAGLAIGGSPVREIALVLAVMAVFHLGVFVVMLASNIAIVALWDVVTEAHAARDAQARLAVSEERLRFARDMHDLLGHSLSALAVKSELAVRLTEFDPQAASREMSAVQHLAREALREVRSAVSGYRDVNLAAEAAGVQAVLTAAGVRCTVSGADVDVPAAQRSIASWVVREGTTNVLRHSSAKRCTVTLRRDDATLVAEVFDDGAQQGADGAAPFGNGLAGLAERVSAAGGALTAGPAAAGAGFLLRAVLPLPERPDGGGSTGDGSTGGGSMGEGTTGDGSAGGEQPGREDVAA